MGRVRKCRGKTISYPPLCESQRLLIEAGECEGVKMNYEAVSFSIDGGVARITLNRPQAFNAFNLQCSKELLDIANRVGGDANIRVVVLTGSGDKAFCAGGDVGEFAASKDVPLLLKEMTGYFHMAISRFAWMNAPLVAVVNGVAAGAGLSLVACCDLAIAADSARFTSAYTQLGLSPDGSSTYFLSRLIGTRRAMELYLTNRTLSAQEALEWGLVNQVFPAESLKAETEKLVSRLVAGPTLAFGGVKRLLMTAPNSSLESQMEQETRQIVELSMSQDGHEGVLSFSEKRKPTFTGR
jgi:2-(1,2-epoxy-1,2-dihydrophenyl)acetyl-CoA isomerase